MNRTGKDYGEMTLEELQREARAALLETDIIDGPMTAELEKLREALNRKRPVEYRYTPEESWANFLERNAEELEPLLGPEPGALIEKTGGKRLRASSSDGNRAVRSRMLIRRLLVAAAIMVLLAGAVLAADSLDLWVWAPRWNAAAGRYEPAAQEVSGESPIPAALAELGITEPVYPAKLPEGFVITESHVSEDPLVLMEQYAREEKQFSITINPIEGFRTAVYQKSGEPVQEYYSGGAVHYIFAREGTITSLRYTDHFVTVVSGSIALEEVKSMIDSLSQVAS